jgi:hypothetical protein
LKIDFRVSPKLWFEESVSKLLIPEQSFDKIMVVLRSKEVSLASINLPIQLVPALWCVHHRAESEAQDFTSD